jgi:hypothetical protein
MEIIHNMREYTLSPKSLIDRGFTSQCSTLAPLGKLQNNTYIGRSVHDSCPSNDRAFLHNYDSRGLVPFGTNLPYAIPSHNDKRVGDVLQ